MRVMINDNFYNVKCLISQKDINSGMMGKNFNHNFDGLLFMMGEGTHNFWMKNCITPLDIIFIKNNRISKIHHDCKPCNESDSNDCPRFEGDGNLVLELPSGDCKKYNLSEGDEVLIKY